MRQLNQFFTLLLIASLLAGCAGNANLWGNLPTPTPFANNGQGTNNIATNSTAAPLGLSPTPSLTPLMVLPLPGSPTPGGIPTDASVTPIQPGTPQSTPTFPPVNSTGPLVRYTSESGDTLEIVGKRFGVDANEIISDVNLPVLGGLLQPGTLLLVPNRLPDQLTPGDQTIPDSEVVDSPSTLGFNTTDYVNGKNGYLAKYTEYLVSYSWTSGAQAIDLNAVDNSLNPRIMLALVEYESHWVLGQPTNLAQNDYPAGYHHFYYKGLFRQLMWASGALSKGYYLWRSGDLTDLTFADGTTLHMDPRLNAGTAAIQYFFSLTHDRASWEQAVADTGFPALYREMFGDPWERAKTVEPMIPANLTQPVLTLPFERGKVWSFSQGPHSAWQVLEGGALAALDFAPAASAHGCVKSDDWVLAPASGKVVRVGEGVVMLDLDGDGFEQTGWDILLLHIGALGRAVAVGDMVNAGDMIGHPSCEGSGQATGTHLHIARKYNGEWILADSPIPFDLDGWVVHYGGPGGKSSLTRGDQSVEACACGTFATRIIRDKK